MGHRPFGLLFPASLYRNRSRSHLWHWRFLGDLLANEVSGQPRRRYAAHSRKKLRRIQNSGCRRSPWRLEGLGSRLAVASACIHRRDREGAGPDHGSGHGESIRRGSLGHCLPGPLFAGIGMPVPLLRSPGSVKRLLLHDFPSDEVSG